MGQFALATTERTLNAVAQEFLFARFTTKAKFHAESEEMALANGENVDLTAQSRKHSLFKKSR